MKKTIFVVLLVLLLTAVAPFATAQDTAQPTAPTSSNDSSFKPLQDAGDVAQRVQKKAEGLAKDTGNTEKYQTYAAIIALIGALTSLLPKLLESASLVSKTRNELQRIEDLADLIQKIKAEGVLSPPTMDSVKTQLEAEIMLAVEGLEKSRQRRVQNKLKQYELGLTYERRLFLLYRPVGIRAWIAHFCAFFMVIYGFVSALDAAHTYRVDGGRWVSTGYHWRTFFTNDGWLILLSFLAGAWLFRMWALWERKRRLTANPVPQQSTAELSFVRRLFLLYKPVGFRAWVAHFCTYSMVLFAVLVGVESGRFFNFLFYLIAAALFRSWALWERKRGGRILAAPLSPSPETA